MLAKLYKLYFDISVCYTIGAFLLKSIGGISIDFKGYFILLITALVSILLRQKRKPKFFATILMPMVSLVFLLPAIPELVVFLLTWVYYSYVTITEHLVISRGEFIDMLRRFLYLCIFLVFVILAGFKDFSAALEVAGPYLIGALLSAVFLLRHLRAVNQMEQMKRYSRQQFMELLAFFIICIFFTLAKTPQYLVEGLKQIYQHLLVPIISFFASIIGMLFYGIIYLIIAALKFFTNSKEINEINLNSDDIVSNYIDVTHAKGAALDWVVPFIYSIGTITGMVVLFLFFRWLMGEKLTQNIPTGILETRENLANVKDKKSAIRKNHPKDSRATVRYYYWNCLVWLQHKRVQLKSQDTTEEINNKCNILHANDSDVKREAAEQLKLIYRKARYQMSEQITKEDAEKAKRLYQTIKSMRIK
ncbi:MAG: hypothetical protein K0R21_2232 [Anaerocolumna sp.]|jgi:hypothetical protein|nr:hypothetical protein [Anaerocolumna sp.]